VIDLDVVSLLNLCAEVGARLAVDRDATGRDQLITMAARTKPGSGEESIETHEG